MNRLKLLKSSTTKDINSDYTKSFYIDSKNKKIEIQTYSDLPKEAFQ